jgi:predicted metalloendopeptidase
MKAAPVVVFAALVTLSADQGQLKSGLDLSLLDPSIRPQDDLYRYANGGWLARAEMPGDRVTYGTFAELTERTEHDLRVIIEELDGTSLTRQQIKDLYASVMDEATLEARGLTPMQPELDRIHAIDSRKAFATVTGELSASAAGGPFGASAGLDARDPTRIIVEVTQGGTLLPDRDYYFKTDPASMAIRDEYLKYLTRIFAAAGRTDSAAAARDVLVLETRLAAAQQPFAESRVRLADDQALTLARLAKDFPGFDWKAWARPQGIDRAGSIVLGQPAFFKAFAKIAQETPLATWKAWLTARYLTAMAPFGPRAISDARFDFFGRVLTGQELPRTRWKQGVSLVNFYMGDALGRLYVEKHFPDSARRRVRAIVANVLEAYREAVRESEWMSPRTKERALEKLKAVETRVGYPDRWRNYSRLVVRADDLFGNARRAQNFDNEYKAMRLARRREPDQWLITPQTVNANYLPWRNEMTLPAAILQPPLFDADAEDAVNYGGIGAIVGHEIGHAFDQRGRKFDGEGFARDWWTADDEAAFEKRAVALVNQYNRYHAMPGQPVNGLATIGENIGDVGGLAVAVRAYRLALDGKPSPVIDGFTGEQRLFVRWAQLWRTLTREEYVRQMVLVNQHAPPQVRANGAVVNVEAFYNAFGVRPGDKLYLDPGRRVKIW